LVRKIKRTCFVLLALGIVVVTALSLFDSVENSVPRAGASSYWISESRIAQVKRSASTGSVDDIRQLADHFAFGGGERGGGGSIENSRALARPYFEQLAALGDPDARKWLAEVDAAGK
jgi:hypothetical protein